MPTKTLGELYSHFVARTDMLVQKYNTSPPANPVHGDICQDIVRDGRALIIIRLQLLWGQFCQELVMRSAVGGCRTITGKVLAKGTGVSSPGAIQRAVRQESSGPFPTWHSPTFSVKVAKRLGTQNYIQIYLALSQTSPVEDLNKVRNYIVHPRDATRSEYLKVAWKLSAPAAEPISLLAHRMPGGATRFETWVGDFQTMALNAVR